MAEPRITAAHIVAKKRAGERVVMITAYDAVMASLVDAAGVDMILVGDSLAVLHNAEETTLPATLQQMRYHGRSVCRGAKRALVVVDLPFLSYQVSIADAIANAGRVLKETGASAVKLEGGERWAPTVRALVDAGIPVVGHIGVMLQSIHVQGG